MKTPVRRWFWPVCPFFPLLLGTLRSFRHHPILKRTLLLTLLTIGLASTETSVGRAQTTATVTTIHTFSGSDGDVPTSGLVPGNDGNLYGTTSDTGYNGDDGTIFRITPAGTLTTLYSFSGTDGSQPNGLLLGQDGNFYGTTTGGGANNVGSVFRFTPAGLLTTLYSFVPMSGIEPKTALVQGSDGNFYGTTSGDVDGGFGTVFQVTPAGVGTVLHSFNSDGGSDPSGLVLGSDGNFYGTTSTGGAYRLGDVFKITPAGSFSYVYSFDDVAANGRGPLGGVVMGRDGNLYGTTTEGGSGQEGTIFQLTPEGVLTTLHSFDGSDGGYAVAPLIEGTDGNFYGTSYLGGENNRGTIFQITASGVFTNLYSFDGIDGDGPAAKLTQASDGTFYGSTDYGGPGYVNLSEQGDGTLFTLTARGAGVPSFFTGETALANGVYYLAFPDGNFFGYYSFLADPAYIYHFDLGYEYVFDAADGKSGVYFYDFASNDFFYTSPTFPLPYLYDFTLNTVLYYYPDPNNPGHYNTNGIRYFFDFATGTIITK